MLNRNVVFFVLSLVFVLAMPVVGIAADSDKKDDAPESEMSAAEAERAKFEEKFAPLEAGAVATQGRFLNNSEVTSDVAGSAPGDKPAPVSFSVSRKGRGDCVVSATSKDTKGNSVSLNLEISDVQSGRRVGSRYISLYVPPGGTVSKTVSCKEGNLTLNLKSSRRSK